MSYCRRMARADICGECQGPAEVMSGSEALERHPELAWGGYTEAGEVIVCADADGCGRIAPYAVMRLTSAAELFGSPGL